MPGAHRKLYEITYLDGAEKHVQAVLAKNKQQAIWKLCAHLSVDEEAVTKVEYVAKPNGGYSEHRTIE
jgi:hypothetical protein